jgi:signal peptidase I
MASKKHVEAELVSIRDTVESIWVAIVLAFVLRAFLVEAFVIPTGSMAPRLLGEHWNLQCRSCGYEYAYGVAGRTVAVTRGQAPAPIGATCPNCDMPHPRTPSWTKSGDRVLVMKFLYPLREPEPWDVVVFKNPQNNRENYIKRLIGLPGETIEIVHGDIFVADEPNAPFRVRRKPKQAQEAMWQRIYLTDYQPDEKTLAENGVPLRDWGAPDGGWNLDEDHGRTFVFEGSDEAKRIVFDGLREDFLPYYGYNARQSERQQVTLNYDVCSDLKLSTVLMPESADSEVTLELTSFAHAFRGRVSADGSAELLYRHPERTAGRWVVWQRHEGKPLKLNWGTEVTLTHVDFQASLWIDGRVVCRSTDQQYPSDYSGLKEWFAQAGSRRVPTPTVAVWASGGPLRLRHTGLFRDVYYTTQPVSGFESGPLGDFARTLSQTDPSIRPDRSGWGTTGFPIHLANRTDDDLDEFFVLGDNSPQSLDGRSWTSASPTLRLWQDGEPVYQLGTVPRYNMIGRALFVYWPAGYRLPGLRNLPIIPNVGRMRLIR